MNNRNGGTGTRLRAPFPYYGGKGRWADIVWKHLGSGIGVYIEPFAGSLAVLLAHLEPIPREVICDTNGWVCNFWRAIRADFEQVAYWSDYPTVHQDLTARHKWLIKWGYENQEILSEDPEWYDPKAAGWWCWGLSNWIGHGWCDYTWNPEDNVGPDARMPWMSAFFGARGVQAQRAKLKDNPRDIQPRMSAKTGGTGVQVQVKNPGGRAVPSDQRPQMGAGGTGVGVQAQVKNPGGHPPDDPPRMSTATGGRGTQAQRINIPDQVPRMRTGDGGQGVQVQRINIPDQVPRMGKDGAGVGTQAQRRDMLPSVADQIPKVANWAGGQGVQVQRRNFEGPLDGGRLLPWFEALANRISRVIVLNRSWESAITPTVLQQTPSAANPAVAIFMDPPYPTDNGRSTGLYVGDRKGNSDDVATKAYEWAIEYGDKYRIGYACEEGDFPVPDGWEVAHRSFAGVRDESRKTRKDQIMFSPACHQEQGSLF